MGMTIEKKFKILQDEYTHLMGMYQMMQADYENRLNADKIAMLKDLQSDIEECVDGAEGSPQFEQGVTIARVQVVEMIQQKIDELENSKDGNR